MPIQVAGKSWEFYTYLYGDGLQAIIRFDRELAEEKEHRGYPHCRRVVVYLPYERAQPNGLPKRQEIPRLSEFEDKLVQALGESGIDCRLAGVMTYGAMREFVFQVENQDKDKFDQAILPFTGQVGDYRVEMLPRAGWTFFDEKIRPTDEFWGQISDRRVIDQLLQAGSDPGKPHLLDHTFLGDPATLQKIKSKLTADGFLETGSGDGSLTLSRESELDLLEISNLTHRLRSYCRDLGAEYDGWGTAVVH